MRSISRVKWENQRKDISVTARILAESPAVARQDVARARVCLFDHLNTTGGAV